MATSSHKPTHKTLKGKVVSAKMHKTIVVEIDSMKTHPIYKKKYKQTNRYLVHDPEGKAKVSDVVVIQETRPLSKQKRWVIASIHTS